MQTWAISGNSGQSTMTIRVLFVCHGNICRSPMAEFIFKKIINDRGMSDAFEINSAATSDEEIWNGVGNPIYPPALEQLRLHDIPCNGHRATQITESDYKYYDYLIYMDKMNYRNMMRIIQKDPLGKCLRLMDLTEKPGDVSDPWYTGNFEKTFSDLMSGCTALADYIIGKSKNS